MLLSKLGVCFLVRAVISDAGASSNYDVVGCEFTESLYNLEDFQKVIVINPMQKILY